MSTSGKTPSSSTKGEQGLAELTPVLYSELRRLAAHYLRRERSYHTLQTTALVHEAYLRLIAQKELHWENKAQFLGVAAQLMRRILVELRFFGGLTIEEAAEVLGTSTATVKRNWNVAKAWLARELSTETSKNA